MKKNINYNNIILASTSARRIEILKNTQIPFEIQASSYEKDMTLDMPAVNLVEYLALGKAQEVSDKFPSDLIIGADTFIVYKGEKLGKPKSEQEALDLLKRLSGKTIEVISGVAILHKESKFKNIFHTISTITMRDIPEEFINMYISTGIPYERAATISVQDIGGRVIKKMTGDYNNILGLPLYDLLDRLYEIDPDLILS